MAESYVIKIGDIPSRKLRKRVRGFLRGADVSLIDNDGNILGVVLKKNRLVLVCDETDNNWAS
ncbi:MAG: hypothetical protein ACP6KW_03355 [Candidatus Thorarchaeota archaeon]